MGPESYVIRRMMDKPSERLKLFNVLTTAHFEIDKRAKVVFKVLKSLPNKKVSADILYDAVSERLREKPRLKKSVHQFIGELVSLGKVTGGESEHYLKSLCEQAAQNVVFEGLSGAAAKLKKGDLEGARAAAEEAIEKSRSFSMENGDVVASRTLRNLKADRSSRVFPTGFSRIDELTDGGARLTEFWIWGAYTSEFKSTGLLAIAYNNMIRGKNVFFCSLEMPEIELQRKLVCLHASRCFGKRLPYREVKYRKFSSKRNKRVFRKVVEDYDTNTKYGEIYIWVPPVGVTVDDVFREFEVHAEKRGSELVVLDYAQKLRPLKHRGQVRTEFTETVDRIKQYALNCRGKKGAAVFSGWQISREGRKQAEETEKYSMRDLSESAGVEQAANVIVWSLYRDDYARRKELKLGIAKSRNSGKLNAQHFVAVDMEYGWMDTDPIDGQVESDDYEEEVDVGELDEIEEKADS